MRTIRRTRAGFIPAWSAPLVAMTTVWALSACTGSASRAAAHIGTYGLESIDGQPLPIEVDEITLGADGAWTIISRSVAQGDPAVRDTTVLRNQGTYTLEGEALTLSSQNTGDQMPGKGTLAGATITSTQQGRVMVYRRVPTSS